MFLERARFIYKFIQSPRRIGSITPSSRFLTQAMLKKIQWDKVKHVVELGAGTGVFTRQLAQRLSPQATAIIFEQDDQLRDFISNQFPAYTFMKHAQTLRSTLDNLQIDKVDTIISGLPFTNFPLDLTHFILDQIMESLTSDGLFITFQYSLQLKKELRKRFQYVNIQFVPLNLPPTFVYICSNQNLTNNDVY